MDDLVKRLKRADEYEPVGHDAWEAAARIEELEADARVRGAMLDEVVPALQAEVARLSALLREAEEARDKAWSDAMERAALDCDRFAETHEDLALDGLPDNARCRESAAAAARELAFCFRSLARLEAREVRDNKPTGGPDIPWSCGEEGTS